MTPLAWTLIIVALLIGLLAGRMTKRTPAPAEPAEDPRLEIERGRADKAAKKVEAQEGELREWAASHKVLEAQVADLKAAADDVKSNGDEAAQAKADLDAANAKLADAEGTQKDLEAQVARLEGQIAAGAGSISGDEFIDAAKKDNQISVLKGDLGRAEAKIAELERRLRTDRD